MSGGTAAGFQYDAFGRRTSKTINSQSTQYLHDGANVVQELGGGVPTANMLNGLGVDERHTCNCNGGSSTLLTDGLGSALALTDSSGAVQTQYTYDAFGNTTSSGAASNNASQYTGRENDGTGLYYYRARYYSPTLQRFVSEDPIGFAGGDVNLYGYVGNSPVNFTDPGGTTPFAAAGTVCLEGALISVGIDTLLDTLAGRKITLSGIGFSALSGCSAGLIGLGLGRALARLSRAGRGIHIDVGGEGLHRGAINLNPGSVTTTTGTAGRPIPNLVRGVGENMPIRSNIANLVSVESAPIRAGTAAEIARVVRPGGSVRLVHPADYAARTHQQVIDAIGGAATQNTVNGITTTIIRVP